MLNEIKNIAIITPGTLPVPCSKGGAVETLIEFYLQENEINRTYHFHVISIYDEVSKKLANNYKNSSFYFYMQDNMFNKIKRFIYGKTCSSFYYNKYMDYYGKWAFKLINHLKPDAVIIENRQGFIFHAPVKHKYPIILHLHNDTLYNGIKFANKIADKFDLIITVSKYLKKRIESINTKSNIEVIYNGIELDKFTKTNYSFYNKKDFGLKDNDFVVIYSGRITEIKGIRELLKSFLYLKKYPQIKLLIVGSSNYGDQSKDDFTQEMYSLSKTIGEQIIFTGYIPYYKMPSIMKLADISIIPSICEDALTLVSIESMASGIPLIITHSGGIPEAVDSNCGIILDKCNLSILPSLIADAILLLYNDKDKRKKMSENCIKKASFFNKDIYTQKIFLSFNKILNTL